jgi:hypothetical protein
VKPSDQPNTVKTLDVAQGFFGYAFGEEFDLGGFKRLGAFSAMKYGLSGCPVTFFVGRMNDSDGGQF